MCGTSEQMQNFYLMMSIFAVRLVFVFSLRDALSTSTAVFNFNVHFRAGGGCMVWQSSTNEDTAFPW